MATYIFYVLPIYHQVRQKIINQQINRGDIMRNKILLISLFLLLYLYCEKDKSITSPEIPSDSPTKQELSKFQVIQVYYDSTVIKSDKNIILRTKAVEKIILGWKENGFFAGYDTLEPQYSPFDNGYYLDFQFEKNTGRTLRIYEFTLRFMLFNNDSIDVDTTAQLYKYPYQSAEIFITAEEVFQRENYHFQDIDRNDNYLFIHPVGPVGLIKYNLISKQTEELVLYSSGDCITSDSIYIFYDIGHKDILRYNLATDTTDMKLDLSGLNYSWIKGLDIYGGILYVLLESSPSYYLTKFDLQGNYLGFIEYSKTTIFMTINGDILYSIEISPDWSGMGISRFNLITETFMENKSLPTNEWEGIRIYQDKFYFTDFYRQIIGTIPLNELE